MWFSRAYYNLHQKVNYLSYSDGWAIGCWFVPILNLYRPYKMMKELFEETKKLLEKKVNVNFDFTANLIEWWWGLSLLNNTIAVFSARFSDDSPLSASIHIISNVLGATASLYTIKVVKAYSNIEPLLNEISDDEQ
jgi:hypothetical protein